MSRDAPRRCYLDLATPAEAAVRNAIDAIEKLNADVRLSEAQVLLNRALNLVADYIDEQLAPKAEAPIPEPKPTAPA
jgi:hypothetical protein